MNNTCTGTVKSGLRAGHPCNRRVTTGDRCKQHPRTAAELGLVTVERDATPTATLYVSAQTGTYHTSRSCSVTRRNHAYNLETDTTVLRDRMRDGFPAKGCKRCAADAALQQLTR